MLIAGTAQLSFDVMAFTGLFELGNGSIGK